MENSGGFRYKILGHVSCGRALFLFFFVSLGIAEISGFSGLSVCAGLSYSRSFHGTLGCASAAGIGGVVRFCGQGDKTFEADFNSWILK